MKNNWKKIDVVVEDETTNEQTPEKKTDMNPLEILNHIQKVWKERGVGKTNDSTPGNNETTADNGALSEENNTSTPEDVMKDLERIGLEDMKRRQEYMENIEKKIKDFGDTIKQFRQQNKDVYMSMENDMNKNTPFATLPGEWEATGPLVRNQDIKMFTQLPTTNHKDFDSIAQEICDLHRKKNSDYGDAAYESYKEFGITSYVIRLGDKYRRLQSLTSPGKEQQVKSESIQDTLMDLAAYAIMAIEAINK